MPCCSEEKAVSEKAVSVREVKVAGVNNKIIMPAEETPEVKSAEKPCCNNPSSDAKK